MSVTLMGKAFALELEPSLKLVLLALADRADDDGGSCHPGQEYLAKKCSMGVRTIRRHLSELEDRGYISRRARFRAEGKGRTSDAFRLTLDLPANLAAGNEPTNRPDDDGLTGQNASDQPANSGRGYTRDTSGTHQTRARSGFASFWDTYPRKAGRRKAEAAYRRALERGTEEEILDGLTAHLPSWRGCEPRFIPHPATWLDQDRWLDEPDHSANPSDGFFEYDTGEYGEPA